MHIIVDNPNTLKVINKLAKNNNTNGNNIMEKALEKGLEIMQFEEEYDCEALVNELNELNKEIEEGKGIKLDVDNLEERYL